MRSKIEELSCEINFAINFFYSSKSLNCIGALSLYDPNMSIGDGERSFSVNLIEVKFEAGNETRENFCSGLYATKNCHEEKE